MNELLEDSIFAYEKRDFKMVCSFDIPSLRRRFRSPFPQIAEGAGEGEGSRSQGEGLRQTERATWRHGTSEFGSHLQCQSLSRTRVRLGSG